MQMIILLSQLKTSTVRLAQDLVLRLGATRSGEGLEVRRSENIANDVIPGLDLEFFSSSEKPVTVSVLGDTEVAKERIHDFVDAYKYISSYSQGGFEVLISRPTLQHLY